MRKQLCAALLDRGTRSNVVFLTGDLGFMALEPLRDRLGDRFINCGIAEQNMVTVAAALAHEGMEVWVYSIAPFCYARALEQIRNDICLHGLPVRLIGNGGGYGYGVQGPTHHALEDYGVLLTLPGLCAYVPAFNGDIAAVVARAGSDGRPSYIRLGRDEGAAGADIPPYAPWRQLLAGPGPVVVATGPLVGPALTALATLSSNPPSLWLASELPIWRTPLPDALRRSLAASRRLCVVEEHVAHGGLGAMLAQEVMAAGLALDGYRHLCARGSPAGRSGSQSFLRRHSGLDAESIRRVVEELADTSSRPA